MKPFDKVSYIGTVPPLKNRVFEIQMIVGLDAMCKDFLTGERHGFVPLTDLTLYLSHVDTIKRPYDNETVERESMVPVETYVNFNNIDILTGASK